MSIKRISDLKLMRLAKLLVVGLWFMSTTVAYSLSIPNYPSTYDFLLINLLASDPSRTGSTYVPSPWRGYDGQIPAADTIPTYVPIPGEDYADVLDARAQFLIIEEIMIYEGLQTPQNKTELDKALITTFESLKTNRASNGMLIHTGNYAVAWYPTATGLATYIKTTNTSTPLSFTSEQRKGLDLFIDQVKAVNPSQGYSALFALTKAPSTDEAETEFFWYTRTSTSVPEPSSLVLLGLGLVGAVYMRRRKSPHSLMQTV